MQHLHTSEYSLFISQLKELKKSFDVYSTSYSKKVKLEDRTFMFSEEKTPLEVMKLIRNVRKDADLYIINNRTESGDFKTFNNELTSYDIEFSKFVDKPKNEDKKLISGYKIDLNSAYWQTALNMGVITNKTNDILEGIDLGVDQFGNTRNSKKQIKYARLKALGALATRKIHEVYIDGERQSDLMQVKFNKLHRALYMNICDKVAESMSTLCYEFFENVLYYYWDCVFIDDKIDVQKVVERIEELGYNCKLEGALTKFQINKKSKSPNIIDINSGKIYPIEEDDVIY